MVLLAEEEVCSTAGNLRSCLHPRPADSNILLHADSPASKFPDAGDVADFVLPEGVARNTCWDVVLAQARGGDAAAHTKALFPCGTSFLCQSVLDWMCELAGRPRHTRPPPLEWSWFSIMGSAVVQADDGSCVISAVTMSIEAQHRLAFERLHGSGSFPFKAEAPGMLKRICWGRGVWYPKKGALVEKVLEVIMSTNGVPTTTREPNDIYLPIVGHKIVYLPIVGYKMVYPVTSKLTSLQAAWLIFSSGPLVGSLYADEKDYCQSDRDSSYVYGGGHGRANHSVVCFAYRFVGDELQIRVMDNHMEDGPLRWVLYSAFEEFHIIYVRPIDRSLLRRTNR